MIYTTIENQTILDIAIQIYGNIDAIDRLMQLNPELVNSDPEWDIDSPLALGTTINYDDEGNDKKTLKELDGKLIISD